MQQLSSSFILLITEHLTGGLGITLNPHWPISWSEDQLVNPYDLFAVNPSLFSLFSTPPPPPPPHFITLFRTKDKVHPVLFSSHLLAIAKKQIHFIVISFVYLEYKQNSSCKSNHSCRQYPVDSHEVIYTTLFRTVR